MRLSVFVRAGDLGLKEYIRGVGARLDMFCYWLVFKGHPGKYQKLRMSLRSLNDE